MTNALPHTSLQRAGRYTFYATREYFAQLTKDVDATIAGDRVLLAAMTLDPAVAAIEHVVDALHDAATRRVHVTLQVDAHAFMVDDDKKPGPLFYHTHLPAKMRGFHAMLQDTLRRLEDAGATVVVTNPPHRRFASPFAGRSHIKASIVNDMVYLGGCNLSTPHLDAMVRWHDPQTANWLYNMLNSRAKNTASLQAFGTTDIRHAVDDTTEIILDVGVKRQSAIYEQALAAIDNAQEWLVITCQFFPNSRTAERLRAAHTRGVRVVPIFNHYTAHSHLHAHLQHAVTSRERLRMPGSFFETELPKGQTFLHAKVLATERELLIGSHNYVPSGVNFGTAEIALYSQDPHCAQASTKLILEEVGLNNSL